MVEYTQRIYSRVLELVQTTINKVLTGYGLKPPERKRSELEMLEIAKILVNGWASIRYLRLAISC